MRRSLRRIFGKSGGLFSGRPKNHVQRQQGFTLIEIMIVVVAIGSFLFLLMPRFESTAGRQDAHLIEKVATSIYTNFQQLNASCSTSNVTSGHALTDGTTSLLAIIDGDEPDGTQYDMCAKIAGLDPLPNVERQGNDFFLDGRPIVLGNSSSPRAFTVTFEDVGEETVGILTEKRVSGIKPTETTVGSSTSVTLYYTY